MTEILEAESIQPKTGKLDTVRISSAARYSGFLTPDTSGNGHDAPVNGTVVLEDGRFGKAVRFDGTQSILPSPHSGGILHDAFSQRSVEFWLKPDALAGIQDLYDEGGGTNGLALRLNGSLLQFAVRENHIQTTIECAFPDTDWHKVTATFDNGDMKLYLDESLMAQASAGYTTISNHPSGSALAGISPKNAFGASSPQTSYQGLLDQVRVTDGVIAFATPAVTDTNYTYNARNQLVTEAVVGGVAGWPTRKRIMNQRAAHPLLRVHASAQAD